jgi:voltage-gated potassium channel
MVDEAPHWPALQARLSTQRERIQVFIARHQLAWDVTMAGLALLFIAIGFFQDHPTGALTQAALDSAEVAITLIFLAEFALRFTVAPSRPVYLKAHWVDLLALLPAIRWLRLLRLGRLLYLLRLARLLRLGVLIRLLAGVNRIVDGIRPLAVRNGVHVFLSMAAGLAVVGGSLVWELEHTINPAFARYEDAIWWAFATMTTVGYGNGPMTVAGRVVAGVVMIAGIACFGVITATVTAFFLSPRTESTESTERVQVRTEDLIAMLEDIRARLARIEQERSPAVLTVTDPVEVAASGEAQQAATRQEDASWT